jgi:hypothetical protein
MFLHNLLNVLVQIANIMGLQKKLSRHYFNTDLKLSLFNSRFIVSLRCNKPIYCHGPEKGHFLHFIFVAPAQRDYTTVKAMLGIQNVKGVFTRTPS